MNLPTKIMLALLGAGLLAGCGSSDDESEEDDDPIVVTYSLSGTVSGLDGSLTLAAGTEEKTLTSNGTFSFDTDFETGDSVTVSITAEPDLQSCEITSDATFTFAAANISTLAVECTDLALYTAQDDTAESGGGEVVIDVLANDTSEYSAEFSLVSVTDPANGTAAITDTSVTYTPDAGYAGTDTFMYTGTDGAQEDTGTVTVVVTQQVTISGRVTDGPIANANVTITIGGQTFTVTADANGDYQLPITVADSSSTLRPRLSAQGVETQSYVTLSSRLPSPAALLAAAGDDGILVRAESNQVQVTQLSTADNLQLEAIAATLGGDISDENMQSLMTEYDLELTLEMAGAIKLLVDDPDWQLPAGFNSIEEFLADAEAYNTMVTAAEASGDLDAAVQSTIDDPEVSGGGSDVGLEAYYGAYVVNNLGSRYTGRWAPSSVYLSAEGMRVGTTSGHNSPTPVALTEREDGSWEAATLSVSGYNMNYFDLVHSWNLQMDAEVALALEAAMNEFQWEFEVESSNDIIKVVSSSETALMVHRKQQRKFLAYSFEYNGVNYVIPEQPLAPVDYVQTWLPQASLQSGVAFEVPNNSKWVVPQIFDYFADIKPEHEWGVEFWYDTQLVTLTQTTATSGTYTNDLTGATGTWSLSEDGTALTLVTAIDEGDAEVTLWYSRNDEHVTELLASIHYIEAGEAVGVITIERGGMLDSGLAVESLIHGDTEMNLGLINMNGENWGANGPIMEGDIGWQYGWHLAASGDLKLLVLWCDDPDFFDDYLCSAAGAYWHQSNADEGDTWFAGDSYLHFIRPNSVSAPSCSGDLTCGGRFVSPVRYNADTGIMTVLELEVAGSGSPADQEIPGGALVEGGVYQEIAPRFNYWTSIPFMGIGPGNGPGAGAGGTSLESAMTPYKKVLDWHRAPGATH